MQIAAVVLSGVVESLWATQPSTNSGRSAPAHGASRPERCRTPAHESPPMDDGCAVLQGRLGWRQPDYESRRWSLQARAAGVLTGGERCGGHVLPRSVTSWPDRQGALPSPSCNDMRPRGHQTAQTNVCRCPGGAPRKNAVFVSVLQAVLYSEFRADLSWLV